MPDAVVAIAKEGAGTAYPSRPTPSACYLSWNEVQSNPYNGWNTIAW